jgi:hypothetical protein
MLFAGLRGLLVKDAAEKLNPFSYLKPITPAQVGFGRVNGDDDADGKSGSQK